MPVSSSTSRSAALTNDSPARTRPPGNAQCPGKCSSSSGRRMSRNLSPHRSSTVTVDPVALTSSSAGMSVSSGHRLARQPGLALQECSKDIDQRLAIFGGNARKLGLNRRVKVAVVVLLEPVKNPGQSAPAQNRRRAAPGCDQVGTARPEIISPHAGQPVFHPGVGGPGQPVLHLGVGGADNREPAAMLRFAAGPNHPSAYLPVDPLDVLDPWEVVWQATALHLHQRQVGPPPAP